MPKYRCDNNNCEDFGIVKTEYSITAKWIDGELITKEQYCPKCGIYRTYVKEHEGFCTNIKGGPNVCSK